ncbi:MAG: sulfurtransferase TusE [Pseudomonadales bacterium]|nr:sulfurtransferase TusE [Pseudomonadales bacterium]
MSVILVDGESIQVDKEGYLKELGDWNERVAEVIASTEGIQLSDNHWEIIRLLQKFHEEFEHSPAMRILVKYVKQNLGDDKGNSIYLLQLFPGSPAKIAAKVAGLPRPTNCL